MKSTDLAIVSLEMLSSLSIRKKRALLGESRDGRLRRL